MTHSIVLLLIFHRLSFTITDYFHQAAESLCMNGRALNEKAIEVSPSSSRVLDRAAEILTPFPPSKNRPRPGDWTCPSCGFSNFQRRTACFRCSYPASSALPNADPMGYSNYGYGPPHVVPHHQMGHQGPHGHGRGAGGGGGMVPFRAGDWKCGSEGCGYHNFAKNVTCLRCGASRAGAAVVADSAFPSPHESSSSYGMTPTSMTGTPAPGNFAPGSGYGSGGFGGTQYGGPPAQYGLPSSMSAPPNAYPPMGGAYGQGPSGGAFDSGRGAESAFSSISNGPASTSGPNTASPYGGGAYGVGSGYSNNHADPFAFITTSIEGLSVNDDNRRNGPNSAKSQA